MTSLNTSRVWKFRDHEWTFDGRARLMGIVNVTPDSFSDGGQFASTQAAIDQALRLQDEGADLLDLGGESTRPGAPAVVVEEELRRVIPVVEGLAGQLRIPLSIDTTKSEVAEAALAAGAHIINDISAFRFDPGMLDVCRRYEAGLIGMHMQGSPATMQLQPHYEDVVHEVCEFLRERQTAVEQAGITLEAVVWDPGIGFGKTAQHNLDLLSNIAALRALGRPILIGHSRKRFLQRLIGRAVDERLFGTVGVTLAAAAQGAELIRVHDIAANRDALTAFQTVIDHRPLFELGT